MRFESISISNLRCLEHLEFAPGAETSLIFGANGSGKTSLLEGFALASLGKSFLSNRSQDIIRTGAQGLSVHAALRDAEARPFAVAVRKTKGETTISLDGLQVMAASSLAQKVPMVVINSKAADILTENPSNRRALIDRTMFHVEPGYVDTWKQYRQALRQRNELIRRQAPAQQATFWNDRLGEFGEQIDESRARVVAAMNAVLVDNPLKGALGDLHLEYSPGWNRPAGLREQLDRSWQRDLRSGHTTVGVHRADLALRANGRGVARRLSRGQGKFIVCSLLLALADFIESESARKSIILIDDLAAELDDKMRGGVVDMINQRGGQRVFTAIKPGELPEISETTETMFHVEQVSQVLSA